MPLVHDIQNSLADTSVCPQAVKHETDSKMFSSIVDTAAAVYCAVAAATQQAAAGGGCFPRGAVLFNSDGYFQRISNISVGENFLGANEKGEPVYSDVVYLPHLANKMLSTFIQLETESGETLRLTESHILPISTSCTLDGPPLAVSTLKQAHEVRVNDCVYVNQYQGMTGANGELRDAQLIPSRIVNVSSVLDIGLYTAVTQAPFLILNGVLASPFEYDHNAAHTFYNIHRQAYNIGSGIVEGPWLRAFTNTAGDIAAAYISASGPK